MMRIVSSWLGFGGSARAVHALAFESVVQRHPDVFSPEAVVRSAERLRSWAQGVGVIPFARSGGGCVAAE